MDAIQSALPERGSGRHRNSDSEFSTPRKYSWDYGADLGADENQGQFISTRRDLTFSGDRSAPEGKSNARPDDDVTPTNNTVKLSRSRTPDILVTPASQSTRTSLDGDAESVKSRSPANVTVISDSGRENREDKTTTDKTTTRRISEDKPPIINRNKTSDRTSRSQSRDTGSSSSVRDKDRLNNKLLDRITGQDQQRDSGI